MQIKAKAIKVALYHSIENAETLYVQYDNGTERYNYITREQAYRISDHIDDMQFFHGTAKVRPFMGRCIGWTATPTSED